MTPTLRTSGLTKRYRGGITALEGVSIDLPPNTVTGLLGRNGAGKTTLMQLLAGHRRPSSGTIEAFGRDPYDDETVTSRICLARESQRYPDSYRVRHALRGVGMLYPNWDDGFAHQLLHDFGLPPDRPIKKLSRGMASMVAAVIGLAARAPITMFDEPYLGLDAVARHLFYDRLLADYAEHPRTIVLSTHLIDEISDLVEHVVVIDRGQVLIDETVDALRQDAVTVSGPLDTVSRFVAGRAVIHTRKVAGIASATVTGAGTSNARDEARRLGLEVSAVTLQELFVRVTTRTQDVGEATPDLAPAGREAS
jgi:ABC-2 type transport system ATP-binding protein